MGILYFIKSLQATILIAEMKMYTCEPKLWAQVFYKKHTKSDEFEMTKNGRLHIYISDQNQLVIKLCLILH